MEKLKTLLWILFAVGVLIYRFVKKMQETAARETRERPSQGTAVPSLPTASFQELLKQMQARNLGEPEPPTLPSPPRRKKPKPEQTPAGRAVPQARSQERTTYRSTSLEAPATARNMNAVPPAARRANTLPRANVTAAADPLFAAQYQPTPPAEPVSQTVRRLLSQPATVRAAFVLGEILQRRY